jgi:ribosomal protein S1
MSDARTDGPETAAGPANGKGKSGSKARNGKGATAVKTREAAPARPPVGTVLEQGGDVPTPREDIERVDYGDTLRGLNEGDVIRGVVVHIDREGVLVDVGTKSEGLIPPHELSREQGRRADSLVRVGAEIDVYVLNTDDDETGQLILSKKRADFEKAWDRVIEAQQAGETLLARVTDRVKGGLVVDLGIRGFVPASHVGTGKVRNLEKYVGMELPLKVIEVDRDRRKVVLSHRLATEQEREAQRKETLQTLAEGQVRPGVVRRITDYGAFVDIGGVDGLLHISEMSWTRIKHPNDVLKVGDEIQVMVLKTNLEQGRISLGLRQILPDPWTEAKDRYHPGENVTGSVTRLVPFGAFVQLEGGLEGIIPNNELSERRIAKPEDVVQVGDQVEVKVLEVRPEERRMTLSLRQAGEGEFGSFGSGGDGMTLGDVYGEALRKRRSEETADEDEEEE